MNAFKFGIEDSVVMNIEENSSAQLSATLDKAFRGVYEAASDTKHGNCY